MQARHIKTEVRELIEDYVHVLDDEKYEQWPDLFTERCAYRVVTRQALGLGYPAGLITCNSRGMLQDRVNSLRKANIYEPHRYRHLLGPTRMLGADAEGRQRARTGFAVLRIMQDGQTDLFLSGIYEDLVELAPEGPRFVERIVALDSSKVDTLIVLPV